MKALFAEGSNGTVYFDGETITVTKTGLWNKLSGNSGRTSIPVELVGRIDWMPPRIAQGAGFILFLRADDPMADLRYRNYGRKDNYSTANSDPLGCAFTRKQVDAFVEIRNAVHELIGADIVDVSVGDDEFVEAGQPVDFTPGTASADETLNEFAPAESVEAEPEQTVENLGNDYSEQLRMLSKLLQDGLLTIEEFEAKLKLLNTKN